MYLTGKKILKRHSTQSSNIPLTEATKLSKLPNQEIRPPGGVTARLAATTTACTLQHRLYGRWVLHKPVHGFYLSCVQQLRVLQRVSHTSDK